MIRAEITQAGDAGAADELVAGVLLDDELKLTVEPAHEGLQLEWIRQLVLPAASQPGGLLSLEADPIAWTRALPKLLHDPRLMAEIVEDDFEPAPPVGDSTIDPDPNQPFSEVLQGAVDAGALHPAVASLNEGVEAAQSDVS